MTATEAPLFAVVEAIAEREGVTPTDIPESLSGTVDPVAVETILRTGDATMRFEYLGYHVTVTYDDQILVELDDRSPTPQTA
jgi:hypothetical protein